ncbi:MAG: homoserine O-acetyltransferase [Nocardioidaceae bacterium]|nr:MAG: homoserine O-acetyltransferase [Nocardioidaceae bacterium]
MSQSIVQRVVLFDQDDPLVLTSGAVLPHVEVAYTTTGTLSPQRDNAVFICHALTGDAEVGKWWSSLVGPGKPIDTDRFFVICPNLLGGCQGTTGPMSINPETGESYGLDFPLLHMSDFVSVHRALTRHLGVERLYAAVGGSLGGMQILQWAHDAPGDFDHAVLVAATSRLTAQNIAFSAVAREAIMRDPEFHDGRYAGSGPGPRLGLAIARMMAHITYVSDEALEEKFGRRLQETGEEATPSADAMGMGIAFAVESYLDHQGRAFLDRFDALSYLYLSRVMDYFDPFADQQAAAQIASAGTRFLVISFDTDWRFDTRQSQRIVRTLSDAGAAVTFREIRSPWGHDSFLLDVPQYQETVAAFLSPVRPQVDARPELELIENLIPAGSAVLDLGCGDGSLLARLAIRGGSGSGVEIDPDSFLAAVQRGIDVLGEDIAVVLPTLPDDSYDTVVVSQTLQATQRPEEVLREAGRVGRQVVVSVPNFGHWRHRRDLLIRGRMPVDQSLPYTWFETPNVHLSTLRDLEELFAQLGLRIDRRVLLDRSGRELRGTSGANVRAASAIYVLAAGD